MTRTMPTRSRTGSRRRRQGLGRHAARLGVCVVAMTLACAARLDACTVTTSGINFGVYNVFSTVPVDSNASIVYQCPGPNRDVEIHLSAGSSGTYHPRTLRQGSNQLAYNLYTDAALTLIWGDSSQGTSVFWRKNVPGNNKPWTVTIYGRVPAQQDVAAGSYTDTIIATINF